MNNLQEQKIIKEFDKLWETYTGQGGFHIGCYECENGTDKEEVKKWLLSKLREAQKEYGEEIMKIIEDDSKEATRVAVPHTGYKKGWHWKSIGEAYIRNKYRKELLAKLHTQKGENEVESDIEF